MSSPTDGLSTRTTLLDRLRQGSRESWDEFIALYNPLLEAYVRKILGGTAEGWEDVRQEVLIKLWKTMPSFQLNKKQGRFRTWLWTVTHNETVTFLRKRKQPLETVPVDLEDSKSPEPPEELIQAHTRLTCKHILERVRRELAGDKKWTCFEEYFQKQRPTGEVARELGLSNSAVYTYTFRVLERCREMAAEYE